MWSEEYPEFDVIQEMSCCPACMTYDLKEGQKICDHCTDEFMSKIKRVFNKYPKEFWDFFDDLTEGEYPSDVISNYEIKYKENVENVESKF